MLLSCNGPHCHNNHGAPKLPSNSRLIAVYYLFCCCQFAVINSLYVILTGLHYTMTHLELACIAVTFLPYHHIANDCYLFCLLYPLLSPLSALHVAIALTAFCTTFCCCQHNAISACYCHYCWLVVV